ncbi:hypothetical protein TNCV_1601401 [Trichonephila clavipes]|nr:hypothetical protein TNCV_1601401 [Trichonephila clavipes]
MAIYMSGSFEEITCCQLIFDISIGSLKLVRWFGQQLGKQHAHLFFRSTVCHPRKTTDIKLLRDYPHPSLASTVVEVWHRLVAEEKELFISVIQAKKKCKHMSNQSLIYADTPQTPDHLEDNIRRVIADIRPQMLEKVIEN